MTTAKSRKSGTTAGRREGTAAEPAGKANESIPVLIRLPRLAVEPESNAEYSAAEDEAGIRETIPLQAKVTDLEPSRPVPDDARKNTDTNAVGKPTGAAIQLHSMMSQASPWLRFRWPRWSVNAGIALGLIAVLMLAFSAIRGTSKDPDKIAEFEAASTVPMAGIPAPELPPIPLSMPALPPAPPPAPTARTAAAPKAASSPAVSASGMPGIAKQEDPSAGNTAAAFAVSQTGVARNSPAAAEPQTSLPPMPESPASEPAAAPADPAPAIPMAAGIAVAADRKAEEAARAEANLPLTRGPAGTEPSTPADLSGYPETNPTTFQYPVDYHLRLRSQTPASAGEINEMGTGGPAFNGPMAGRAAANGWQPNTARLQPRIEPPPVR